MEIKEIANFVMKKYPNSSIAVKNKGIPFSENDDVVIEELMSTMRDIIGLCCCGDPDGVSKMLRDILCIYEESDYATRSTNAFKYLGLDDSDSRDHRIFLFILYRLDHIGFIEHGSSVYSGWVTEYGRMFIYLVDKYLELQPPSLLYDEDEKVIGLLFSDNRQLMFEE